MKTLSPTELIELLPVEDATLARALQLFETSAPVLCRDPGYIKQLIAEGWMETAQITWRDQVAFVLGWHLSTDRGLWIDIAQSLKAGAPIEALFEGVEILARLKSARYIRWLTMRRGLARYVLPRGYQAEAVLLTKVL